jgi:hypothetical protein
MLEKEALYRISSLQNRFIYFWYIEYMSEHNCHVSIKKEMTNYLKTVKLYN